MELKPVEHSHRPTYPTRREVIAGAASFALVSLTRCALVYAEDSAGEMSVAPIFEHGAGRGATGCMVIVPPVFLSEEESLQIANEELAQHGIQLVPGTVVKELKIAPRCMQVVETDETTQKTDREGQAAVPPWAKSEGNRKFVEDVEHAAPLRLTGVDGKKSIALAFVCVRNYKRLGGVDPNNGEIIDRDGNRSFCMSTIRKYDFKDAAKYLVTEIGDAEQSRRRLYVGVLYDPVAHAKRGERDELDELRKAMYSDRETAAAESKKLLRQQTQEFAAWLKQQGAI